MPTTVNNPMGELAFTGDESPTSGAIYLGKYRAAKGPDSLEVSVKTGDGNLDDSVQITGADGKELVSIPYRELFSFCVITGVGSRKPAISFEHKPDQNAKSGKNHVRNLCVRLRGESRLSLTRTCASGLQKVWMESQAATSCAEDLMEMLKGLEQESTGK